MSLLRSHIGYTSFTNLHDYTTSTFPVTSVDPAVDVVQPVHAFHGAADKQNYEAYSDPEEYRDAPIGLQLVGRKYEEEAVIRFVDRSVHG